MKKLIAFDLDGTLAESKQPIQPEMGTLLKQLLGVAAIAVISGGDWPQFETQVVAHIPAGSDLSRLFIMPTTGTKLYRYENEAWHAVYADVFDAAERKTIIDALDKASAEAGLNDSRTWGDKIEDRGSQITYSGLGQEAPLDAKKAWDPDFAKRKKLQAILQTMLPDLSINVGGSTSVDITRRGIDKAYAIRRLSEVIGIAAQDMLFLGDAMYPGGNDYPVKAAGIDSIAVRDVAETRSVVSAIIACLK
ncbi:HAD-IIB family hydrolase [Flavisphingomonas formosensis]|uniref:HAD-IIB family hydrolase n=1 Tax=Flavisphingomonas formosensis TaxID=861534 RepID=UPI0012FACF83|nr:HAD-IIB family hydrolase [Sphingomonas formosensis]